MSSFTALPPKMQPQDGFRSSKPRNFQHKIYSPSTLTSSFPDIITFSMTNHFDTASTHRIWWHAVLPVISDRGTKHLAASTKHPPVWSDGLFSDKVTLHLTTLSRHLTTPTDTSTKLTVSVSKSTSLVSTCTYKSSDSLRSDNTLGSNSCSSSTPSVITWSTTTS